MNVRLHIEELVLEGFPPGDRHRIAEAVQAELARLFADEGVPSGPASGESAPTLDGGTFPVAPQAGPSRIGAQVAQAVYRGLAR